MSAVIGALRAVLSLDSAAYEKGAKRATASMTGMQKRLAANAKRMKTIGKRMSLALTAPMVGAATLAVKQSLQVVDAQAKMAQSMQTSVKSIQVLERAGELAGVSMGEITTATRDLTKRLSQAAAGGGPAVKTLKRLGLSAEALMKLPLDEQVAKINGALEEFVPVAERGAVASDLFGSRGFLAMQRIDTATLRTAAQDVEDFGIAVSEADADQIEKTNDALSRLGMVGRGVGNQLAVAFAPTFEMLADKAAEVAKWFNNLSDRTQRYIGIGAAAAAAIGPLAIGLGFVLSAAVPLVGVLAAISVPMLVFAATAAAAASIAYKLYTNWDLLAAKHPELQSTANAAAVVWDVVKTSWANTWDAITEGASSALTLLSQLFSGDYGGALSSAINMGQSINDAVTAPFKALWTLIEPSVTDFGVKLKDWAVGLPEKIASGLSGLADKAKGAVSDMSTALASQIKQAAKDALKAAKEIGTYIIDGIKSGIDAKWQELKKKVTGLADLIPDWFRNPLRIHSPSRVTAEIGEQVVDGLIVGLKGREGALVTQVVALGDLMSGTLEDVTATIGQSVGDMIFGLGDSWGDAIGNVVESVKRGLSNIVGTGIQNILIGGGSGSGSSGTGSSSGGGSNALGFLGSVGGVGASFMSGASGLMTALGGGLGSAGTYLSAVLGTATTSVGAFAAAAGAVVPIIGGIVAAVSLLSSAFSRKYYGTALRGTLGADGFDGTQFDFYKGGAFRSNKEVHSDVPAEIQAMLDQTVDATRDSIHTMADVLGLASKGIDKFSGEAFTIWTNGKTQEEIAEALNAELSKVAEGMADLVLKSDRWSRAGETSLDTLTRLGTSLIASNEALDLLGQNLFRLNTRGADAASALVDLFGGIDGFQSATASYFNAFYSEEERVAAITRTLAKQFEDLNVQMPKSRDGYRALIEAQDLNTDSGRALYATLIGLASGFDTILPVASSLTAAMQGMADGLVNDIDLRISDATELARIAKQASGFWLQTAEGLRDFLREMAGTDLGGANGAQQFLSQRNAYLTALDGVKSGDTGAASDLAGLARSYLTTAASRTRDSLEFARIAGKVRAELSLAAGVADLEASSEEVMRNLAEQQVEVLGQLKDYILAGNIDADVLKKFSGNLGTLEKAIKQAEMFSYDYLKERLKVTVDVLADASIPDHMRKLLNSAASGIESTIDFLVRSTDLTPDLKWIALQSSTEHLKSLRFIVNQDLPNNLKTIAIEKVSTLDKTLNLIAGSDVSRDLKSLALTSASSLSTTVSALLNTPGSNKGALRLALDNVGTYTAHVDASLMQGGLSDAVKRIVMQQTGTYSAGILATVKAQDLSDRAQRILLKQQGDYIANIGAAIDPGISGNQRRLLLKDATEGFRTITLNKVDLSGLSKKNKWLLEAVSGATDGKVVMSGGFAFDPSEGFKTWFETSTQASILNPMSSLQNAITALRQAVVIDFNQRKAESDRAAKLAVQEGKIADLKNSQSKAIEATQKIIDQIKALEAATGTDMRYKNGDNILQIDGNGLVQNKSDGHVGGDIAAFRKEFYGANGLQAQLFSNKAELKKLFNQIEKQTSSLVEMKADVSSLPIPDAAQWAATAAPNFGPQIAGQALNGVEEQPVLNEISKMRSEQRQLLLAIERNTDDIAVKTRRFDAIGMKERVA